MDIRDDDKFDEAISRALEKGTDFELSHDFADRVMAMVQKDAIQKESQRDKWWLITGIVSMIGALVYAFTKVEFSPRVGVFTFFQGYWGLVIFGILFVVGLHVIDKLLLKKQESG